TFPPAWRSSNEFPNENRVRFSISKTEFDTPMLDKAGRAGLKDSQRFPASQPQLVKATHLLALPNDGADLHVDTSATQTQWNRFTHELTFYLKHPKRSVATP
ncbi:MAG: hypothetical protein VYE53_06925, partial [Planctomycetota bacterium]|nr:hypothetical protein [Planctomycetota bacterium]